MDGLLAQDVPVSVEINDLLWVGLPDEQNSLTYRSRVEDMKNDRVIVAWPTDAGVRIPIREQQRLAVAFARQDAVYSFSAVVEDRSQVPIPQLTLRPTGCAERIQRRQYFRVKTSMHVELIGNDRDVSGRVTQLRSHTHDVSGSGISIYHTAPIPVGTVFDTRLILPGELPPIKAVSKVVQSTRTQSDTTAYRIGMHFLTIKESDRSRIIRVLFRIQQSGVHE